MGWPGSDLEREEVTALVDGVKGLNENIIQIIIYNILSYILTVHLTIAFNSTTKVYTLGMWVKGLSPPPLRKSATVVSGGFSTERGLFTPLPLKIYVPPT